MCVLLIIQIACRCCGTFFNLCRSCFRGQAYCSEKCRISRQRQLHKEAQKKYRQTEKGKKFHQEAEKQRRIRRRSKNVDDEGSTTKPDVICCLPGYIISALQKVISYALKGVEDTGTCHLCGKNGTLCYKFPRRGYGKAEQM